ncbi:MAG: glycosyltransferase [Candidatus Bathyarchaeota archaeon]|nr:glycosyltransferase [Candidatus Bathyarchaeota archaeon]
MSEPMISFVLPTFNEGEFIEGVLEKLDSTVNGHGLRYEVVVVDDGSFDDTRLRALRYAAKNGHVRVVGYDRNVGKGFAVKTGFWKAVGDAVVFFDGDLDIDVGQVKRYVDALKGGDIVVGSKWHPDSVVEVSFVRRFLSHGFNVLVRLLTGVKVGDTQVGIKAVRRKAFVDVFRGFSVKRYAFDVELLVLARVFGLRVVELPVKLKLNKSFSSRQVWRMFLDLLGIAYRLRVKKWYQRGVS